MGNAHANPQFNVKNADLPQSVRNFFEYFPGRQERKIRNPGLFEDLDETWESIQPKLFDGLKICLSQRVTDNIDVQNSIKIDPRKPNDYNISSKVSSNADFPVIWCELDQRGMLKTKFLQNVTDRVCVKAMTRLYTNYFEVPKFSLDYRGDDFSATFMVRFIRNPFRSTSSIAAQYLHSVTREFALGFEYLYKFDCYDPSNVAVVGRYSINDAVLSGKIQKNSAQIRFWREFNPNIQIGFEVNSDFLQRNAVGAISYQMALRRHGAIIKGSLDSHFTAFAVLEKAISEHPFTFSIALGYNYANNNFKTGFGFEATY